MISVVIPTWNEEENLARAIASVRGNRTKNEIIVVDGGSSDRTKSIAREMGADFLGSPVRHRARQMNQGAENAGGEIILFLHADLILPPSALDAVVDVLQNRAIVGGGFARRFDSPSLFLRCTCLLAEFRNRAIGWLLGDQAIFARRAVFVELGGFRPMDRFEDLDFSRRLGGAGRIVTLRPVVLASARRFAREGPIRRTLRDFLLTLQYLRGDPRAIQSPDLVAGEHVC